MVAEHPVLPEMVAYLDAVLTVLGDEQQPDHRENYGRFINPGRDNSMHTGFRVYWNQPDAWPYGVVVRWTAPSGWLFCEPGNPLRQLVDELVPYPELVAATLSRLLKVGPDEMPMTGATRWPGADALLAVLDEHGRTL